jgi:hypothetical protein
MQKMERGKDSDERKLEKAGQNVDASTEDALLNRKKTMASAEMVVICRKLEKAGQNADASTEDALLNKKAMASAEMVICKKIGKKQGKMVPTLPQRTASC